MTFSLFSSIFSKRISSSVAVVTSASLAFGFFWNSKREDRNTDEAVPIFMANEKKKLQLSLVQKDPLLTASQWILKGHGLRTPLSPITTLQKQFECDSSVLAFVDPSSAELSSGVKKPGPSVSTNQLYRRKPITPSERDGFGKPLSAKPCEPGQLTNLGRVRSREVGKWIHQRYVQTPIKDIIKSTQFTASTTSSFIATPFKSQQIFVRSTDTSRTQETIEAILDEAFPERCPCSPPIVIYRLSKDDENMYLRTRCRKTKSTVDKILSSREFEEGLNNLDYKEVTKSLKRIIPRDLSKSKRSWNAAYNTVETLKEHKTQYSSSLSADLIGKVKALSDFQYTISFASKEVIRCSVGGFLGDLMKPVEEMQKNRAKFPYKMMFYSGHDNTLAPILIGLSIAKEHPPMGSYLVFEYWVEEGEKNPKTFVRILYNGNVRSMEGCPEFCPLLVFENKMHKLIPKDFEKECFD